jgi:dTDP-4-dehydrorhamnose 3,5-epimerase
LAKILSGAKKDPQLITPDWHATQELIEGVSVREVLHVPRDHGVITEMFRLDWDLSGDPIVQIYQSRLFLGALGAWSCHKLSADRLFVNEGLVKIALYDARSGSKTFGVVNEFYAGDTRPLLLTIPPGIWHGLQNVGTSDALVLNFPTRAYDYENPDHYRLPYDTPEIPYSWSVQDGINRLRSNHSRDASG